MADQWYFAHGGTKFGPYSAAQLKGLAAAGQIHLRDTVWKEGMRTGVAAARVNKLFPEPAAAPPAEPDGPVTSGLSPPPAPSERPPPPDPPADSAPSPDPAAGQPTALQLRLASPEDLELAPGESPVWAPAAPAAEEADEPAGVILAAEGGPPPPSERVQKWRVCEVRGGVIRSQDGMVVRYTKKCPRCGYVDLSVATAPIRGGVTRATFFCPKCRKQQAVEIHAKQG